MLDIEFQGRVAAWVISTFGVKIAQDIEERNHRFFEEAAELVQSTGMTRSEAHQLVDYVFDRPVGEPVQELGGVMVTLGALAQAIKLQMIDCGWTELGRCEANSDKIRVKQAAKPKHSALPVAQDADPTTYLRDQLDQARSLCLKEMGRGDRRTHYAIKLRQKLLQIEDAYNKGDIHPELMREARALAMEEA